MIVLKKKTVVIKYISEDNLHEKKASTLSYVPKSTFS